MKNKLVGMLLAVTVSAPAFAAEAKTCDDFMAAFGRAAKLASGKDLSADDASFWKKQCAKKPEAEVKKDTKCFGAAKVKDDVKKCMN